ncbi:MAG TPA: hypothetical protein VGV67_13560 [Solirubrobacteraceae bacterium]|nr:hypothetical protein [Solirubrobacteraceae bacterium]
MAFNMNFNVTQNVSDGKIVITGSSEPLDDVVLASRHVVLRQGAAFAEGAAPGEPGWETKPLPADGFGEGDALAIGTETYVVDNAASQDERATFVSVNWSQIVRIET